MRTPIAAAVVLLAGGSGAAAETVAATSRIDAVTVFPSGAEVVRTARVTIAKGEHTVVFANLPAEAVASSIRVDGKSAQPMELGAVDSRRLYLSEQESAKTEAERKRLEAEIETFEDQRRIAEARIAAADVQKSLVANLANLPNRPPLPAGAAPARDDWASILALMGTSLRDIAKARIDAEVEMRTLDRRLTDLRNELTSLAPSQEERTEVKIAVKAEQSLEADLTVRYQVASASWSPSYDARLATGSKTKGPALELTRRATITQQTGEAWEDVAIQLATARPTAGTAAPQLATISVDFFEPRPVPMAAPASRAIRQMADGAAPPPPAAEAVAAMDAAAPAAPVLRKATRALAEAEVAPFQTTYLVSGRASVATTGEPKSLDLKIDRFEPQLLARTVPKRDAKAYLYAKVDVPRGSPMLPGPVALFRDGTFVGNGQLPLLAGGEKHELGFGADDMVRVRHSIAEEKRGETGLISASKTDERNYRLSVKNMHERSIEVSVLDQIPVSRQDEIKVEWIGRHQPTVRDVEDRRGVVAWDMKLEADEEKVIEFGYRVIWPAAKSITYSGR
ncbi:MAG: mucoidy inhibitor MuiA family protein [Hyphomicrobiaceae bacterium]|nr:mucoidy inhibitor MuiA family protein [Hyphomicrobiaceae bacterium]